MFNFKFGEYTTQVSISRKIPSISEITAVIGQNLSDFFPLIICDENTDAFADEICGGENIPRCTLKSGEENKNWDSVHAILSAAYEAGIGRDGVFIAVGGGVIGDLAGFAASIYMRGCRFILVSTTLLSMVDASVGGKTGFDLFNIKNFAGTFYPAHAVFIPIDCLKTLPKKEWKSGMAELIKTAILSGDDFFNELEIMLSFAQAENKTGFPDTRKLLENDLLQKCIEKSVLYKGKIVSEDLLEKGIRKLLNLGHTFAHALESAAGLGNITHGEAVAWGIVCSCKLGLALGVTPPERAEKITKMITSFGYVTACPHPLVSALDTEKFLNAMKSDKKKKHGELVFIIPDELSAKSVTISSNNLENKTNIIEKIIKGII